MLLDTSGLFSLHVVREHNHLAAKTAFFSANKMLTHSYVLAELVTLAQARGVGRVSLLAYLADLMRQPDIQVVWVDRELHAAASSLLAQRLDKAYSMADALSFVLMRRNDIREALTTDKHFVQEGFVRMLEA